MFGLTFVSSYISCYLLSYVIANQKRWHLTLKLTPIISPVDVAD